MLAPRFYIHLPKFYNMKYFVFCFLFIGLSIYAQEIDTSNVTPMTSTDVYLLDLKNPKKKVRIDPEGTVVFVKYDKTIQATQEGEVEHEKIVKYTGTIDSLGNNMVFVSASEESHTTYENYVVASKRSGQYFDNPKLMTLNLNEIDGLYYSSRRREASRNIMFSVLGVSVFTSLVLAPLLSLEYKKTSATDATGFDRPMYFAIAGAGLVGAAISLPIIYLLRPKYYRLQGDNYATSKKRWMLTAQ